MHVTAYKKNKGNLDEVLDDEGIDYIDVQWHNEGIVVSVKLTGFPNHGTIERTVLNNTDAVHLATQLLNAVQARNEHNPNHRMRT